MENFDGAANADKNISAPRPVRNVGATLREAREAMGLSVHDIANRIKFAPRQVEALEENDFGNLPQATFLRGFVRSYARMLELDEAPLIAALPGEPSAQVVARAPMAEVAFPSLLSLQRVNLLWLAGALGIALILGLFVFLQKGEPAAASAGVVVEAVTLPGSEAAVSAVADTEAHAEAAKTVEVAAPVRKTEPAKQIEPLKPAVVAKPPVKAPELVKPQEPVKVREPVKAPEPTKAFEPVKVPEPVKANEPVKPRETNAAKLPVAQTAVPVPEGASKPELPLEVLMRRPLHFVFGEAMWAEVIDVHGAVLLSRNVPRGSEKWIGGPGRAPYEISISNPRKVKLYYKGSLIDLSAYPATETAHLKVK